MLDDYSKITLTDEDGVEVHYEILDLITFQEQDYVILLPEGNDEYARAIAMAVVTEDDNESYCLVDDPYLERVLFDIVRAKDMQVPTDEPWALFRRAARPQKILLHMLLRLGLPVLSYLLLRPLVSSISLSWPDVFLPYGTVLVIFQCLHMAAIGFGTRVKACRGIFYEIAAALLPAEIFLSIYLLQFRSNVVYSCLVVLLSGLAMVITLREILPPLLFAMRWLGYGFALDVHHTAGEVIMPRVFPQVLIRRYLVLAAAVILLTPSCLSLRIHHQLHPPVSAQDTIDIEALKQEVYPLFYYDVWPDLSHEDRLRALQGIADLAAAELDIAPLEVVEIEYEDYVVGEHMAESRMIGIVLETDGEIREPLECIRTIIHECRHAYQFDSVLSLNWGDPEVLNGAYYQDARRWRENYSDYHNGRNTADHDTYYNQVIEVDARRYSHQQALYFLQEIDEHERAQQSDPQ